MYEFYGRFSGQIYQDYGNHDNDISIDPEDYRACILDDPDIEGDDEMRKERILNVVTNFQLQVNRIKANDLMKWRDVMELVRREPEHLVKKNITFDEIVPGFEYWTREGRVTRMIIQKPANPEHFEVLHRWTAVIFFDEFHKQWKTCDVESLLDDDRYLVAWYALWRKWPIQYKVWEWAGRYKEVRNALKAPNYSVHFRELYMKEIRLGKMEKIPQEEFWSWQRHHLCPWDDFNLFYRDPSEIVSKDYLKLADYDIAVLGKLYKEWQKVRDLEDDRKMLRSR